MSVTEGMDVARVRASARSIIDEAGRFGQSRTGGGHDGSPGRSSGTVTVSDGGSE